MHPIDSEKACPFVGETLRELRKTVGDKATVLGFVGCPYTLATYLVEASGSCVWRRHAVGGESRRVRAVPRGVARGA